MDDKLVRLSDVEQWILTESASIDTPADRDAVVERMRYSIPTVDAVEVIHSRWVEETDPEDSSKSVYCAECKRSFGDNPIGFVGWVKANLRHCPKCGARMDGLYEFLKRGLEEAIAYENGEIECRTETRKVEDGDD